MPPKKNTVSFVSLRKDIEQRNFLPIYVLQGEEPYYIDKLQELVIDKALTEDQRDFNLSVYYGNNADVREVIGSCRQYPVFSDYKVVVLREAQLVPKQPGHKNDLDLLAHYAEKPLAGTVLVICHKEGSLKSKPFIDALRKNNGGVVFTSDKVKQGPALLPIISEYVSSIGCNIDSKASSMLADFVGANLSRLFSDLDKLSMLVGADHRITPDLIEKNIGISKDYNNSELVNALSARDGGKAFRIVDYFERNPKNNPLPLTLAVLFGHFSNALIVSASRGRSADELMASMGLRQQWQLRKYTDTTRYYNTASLVRVIGYLRECDTRSKGINYRTGTGGGYDLLKELVYKITHS